FKNTLAFNGATLMGAPGLYGGYEYIPSAMNHNSEISLKEKHNQALLLMPRIFTEEANFLATMTDTSWGNYSYIADLDFVKEYPNISAYNLQGRYTDFFLKENSQIEGMIENLEQWIVRNLLWVSLFREFPILFKPIIYYNGTYFNSETVDYSTDFLDWYSCLTALPAITSFNAFQGAFIMITNEVTHTIWDNDSKLPFNKEVLLSSTDPHYKENFGALLVLGEWFSLMKLHDVYNNTRIIIVSDHGIGSGVMERELFDTFKIDDGSGYSKNSFRSLLLYKDFDAEGGIKTDMTFMSTADVPVLALKEIVQNPINPFTGKKLDSTIKSSGLYVTTGGASGLWKPEHSKSEYIFTVPDNSWYHVKDNIFVDSNWTQEVPQ
ncbi:MAG: hypothetical protein J6R96_00645, partial [Spirochaetaceae bacterium]|nr:hypothetical protein [Spirochaetaceae bacterium]